VVVVAGGAIAAGAGAASYEDTCTSHASLLDTHQPAHTQHGRQEKGRRYGERRDRGKEKT